MLQYIKNVARKIKRKLFDKLPFEDMLLRILRNKEGIEIGGPSAIFSNVLPIYPVIKRLDGCNFSTSTVWEGQIQEGVNYSYFEGKKGYQYISEASNLDRVESNKYDFLLASHCLEHCANTLKTMEEWRRVVKPGGYLLLILPDKQYTFDHNRPTTSFEHLMEDYKNGTDETDLTHLAEILELHDLSMDAPAGNPDAFKRRSLDNYQNRCLHHHVFDFDLLHKIFNYFNIKVVLQKSMHLNQIIVGRKK